MERSNESILELLADHQSGWSLPGAFYSAPQVYAQDIERFWLQGWIFVGHACESPKPGDFFTVEIGTEPIVVIRGQSGTLHAFYNICRHRGSILCTTETGHQSRLVCPYHQWAYDTTGRLISARGMPEDLNKDALSLRPVRVGEFSGLVFVSLAEHPPDFQMFAESVAPLLNPQGLVKAKLAKRVDYRVEANWKLIWENNRECYHCNVNHPQYIKANFDHYNEDDTSPAVRTRINGAVSRSHEKWAAARLKVTHANTGMTPFPAPTSDGWFSANRTALTEDYLTESMDGKLVSSLMGDYTDPDVGTLRIRTLPNFWNHSSCDHSVSTRLLPDGPTTTNIRVYWLVDEAAVEGQNYHLERLMPFWQLTSEQDWEICERQQKGVNSRAYTPGPYSPYKEYNVRSFVDWYVNQLTERSDETRCST